MAKKVILGTDIARDAFKIKVNDNFTELYNKDVALEERINNLAAEVDLKANKAQPNWITPTLQNGWVSHETVFFRVALDPLGKLVFKGAIKDGASTTGTVLFVLPAGYRPTIDRLVSAISYSYENIKNLNVLIKSNGNVELYNNTAYTFVSFDSISLYL